MKSKYPYAMCSTADVYLSCLSEARLDSPTISCPSLALERYLNESNRDVPFSARIPAIIDQSTSTQRQHTTHNADKIRASAVNAGTNTSMQHQQGSRNGDTQDTDTTGGAHW